MLDVSLPHIIELCAVCFSAAGVWLTTQRSLLGWPISFLATLLYGWVFFHAHLYADAILQAVFALSTLYGWALWARDKQKGLAVGGHVSSLPAVPLSTRRLMIETSIAALLTLGWIIGLKYYSDDPSPILDGGLSGASLLAQLWTAQRHRESWLLWAIIDIFYTGMFINRQLDLTALLYGGYALLGLYGYRKWRE